jgi:osmotically-inducible protein OsmY
MERAAANARHDRGQAMKTDDEIRDDVISELRWDPQISIPEAIGVAVTDGAVALTGHAPTYAEKLAAERTARRVYGVKAAANDLTVQLAGTPRDDADIARAIAHILEWNVQIPAGQVQATVENGWVTLDGHVDHDFHRREIERMVRHVRGVTEVDASHIRVEVAESHCHALRARAFADRGEHGEAAAAAAPGVAKVENHLVVSP